jgi:hypothetical protein
MTPYEFINDQRKYFGLNFVNDDWDRQQLSDTITVYFDKDKLVKVLNYSWGYVEYDTDIHTRYREIILPKTNRGKEQKLTIARVIKIKGIGVQFSGSFQGGGINVYDNKRNIFFIKGFADDGEIKTYEDIDRWVSNYIAQRPSNYFDWLNGQLEKARLRVKVNEGDVIAFRLADQEYGFARILLDVFAAKKKSDIMRPELEWVHPRSLIVAPYGFYSNTLQIDIDRLIKNKTLPALCIFDLDVYRGEMPIVGHRPLSGKDRAIPFPNSNETCITIPYTKSDIETFIALNGTVAD